MAKDGHQFKNNAEDSAAESEQTPTPGGAFEILTEPLSLNRLKGYFRIGPDKLKELLPSLGAIPMGGRYRIPLRNMPTLYWKDCGLLLLVASQPGENPGQVPPA